MVTNGNFVILNICGKPLFSLIWNQYVKFNIWLRFKKWNSIQNIEICAHKKTWFCIYDVKQIRCYKADMQSNFNQGACLVGAKFEDYQSDDGPCENNFPKCIERNQYSSPSQNMRYGESNWDMQRHDPCLKMDGMVDPEKKGGNYFYDYLVL